MSLHGLVIVASILILAFSFLADRTINIRDIALMDLRKMSLTVSLSQERSEILTNVDLEDLD